MLAYEEVVRYLPRYLNYYDASYFQRDDVDQMGIL